jgi:hypothetical protein
LVMFTINAMKLINSNHVTPFGGLNFVLAELDNLKIDRLLKNNLPDLPMQSTYSWKDILYSFWSIFFCGGDCIEDLSGNFKFGLKNLPFMRIPSPDRVLERIKELSQPSEFFKAPRGISTHEFCFNDELNILNLKLLKQQKAFKNRKNVLDYDNTLIFTDKKDAKKSYKQEKAYCPGVGFIGKNVVFIENRNGNSGAKDLQSETLQRMFNLLEKEEIHVDIFRADSGSFDFDALHIICRYCSNLFIKARMNETLASTISQVKEWEKIEDSKELEYIGETIYLPFKLIAKRRKREYNLPLFRLVIKKTLRDDGQYNLFTGEAFNYTAIITLDKDMSKKEVFDFYNQRGAAEREFDVLKNDFGWKKLPSSNIAHNNVYLILTAMCRNIYEHIICIFSNKFKNLKSNFRIKKFIFRFISIPAKWIKSGRTNKLKIYGDIYFKT